ncbi:cytochrome c [Trinickia sp. EG282A]|uniref:cytochrome c n=1 Tax=Trinickia sp. EG282A TaxID=3237013 RepID=UPI0034D2B5AC
MRVRAIVLALSAAMGGTTSIAANTGQPTANAVMRAVEVTLPAGASTFPPGQGADLANEQCAMCHSVDMVMRQPPLSFDTWKAEVAKMRTVYGAPLAPEQIDDIARYLTTINGK